MKRMAALVGMLVPIIFATPATADTTTLLPAADAYVNGDPKVSSRNYGTATTLQVDDKPKVYSYVRFDVSLPGGAIPTGATLRLYTAASSGAGFTVHQTDGATWTETGITYSSRPAIQLTSSIGGVSSWSSSGWKEAPLRLTPSSGVLTLVVRTASPTAKSFHSRENANDPQLVVSYSPAPSPPPGPASRAVRGRRRQRR
jgi:hypothetical protein